MINIENLGKKAKAASYDLGELNTKQKNEILKAIAEALNTNKKIILEANDKDIKAGRDNGMSEALLDRLALSEKRISDMSDGALQVAALDDPVGEVESMITRPNGLRIGKMRVPLGVIAIIFEARPNVTVDAAVLCLKSGNACILKGGKEAINSNIALAGIMRGAIEKSGYNPDFIQVVEDTSRDAATALMRLNGYVDVLIPRGGAGLIQAVVQNSTVPVIETGVGNCHVYIDSDCDIDMGVNIIYNAKTSRPSVCNAAETLLVAEDIAEKFLPQAKKKLDEKHVELRGCDKTLKILPDIKKADEEDYKKEFLDYILAVKVVKDVDEAIKHINKYGTKHSEAIVTNSYNNSQKFLQQVDAAAVYVNASTRFTDGSEFGFGAEIGISTQKMHARGPMGLKELTTSKYIVYGSGQIR